MAEANFEYLSVGGGTAIICCVVEIFFFVRATHLNGKRGTIL